MAPPGCSWNPLATRRLSEVGGFRTELHASARALAAHPTGCPVYLPSSCRRIDWYSYTRRVTPRPWRISTALLRRRGVYTALASFCQPGPRGAWAGATGRPSKSSARTPRFGRVCRRPPSGASNCYAALQHEVARAAAILPRYRLDRCDDRHRCHRSPDSLSSWDRTATTTGRGRMSGHRPQQEPVRTSVRRASVKAVSFAERCDRIAVVTLPAERLSR